MSLLAGVRARWASGGLVFADQALVSGANFATTVLLVRGLGLDGFGRFALLWMGVLGVLALQQALIGTPMLTIGPKHGAEGESDGAREYYSGVLRLELAFLAVACAACSLAVAPFAHALGLALAPRELAVVACAVLARSAQDFVRQNGFARELRQRVFALDVVAYGGQCAALVVLFACGALTSFAAWTTVAVASGTSAVIGLAGYGAHRAPAGALARVWSRHLAMSRWLAGLAVLQWFTSNAFVLAAGALLGPAAAGALKAGQTILGGLHVLLLAVENVVPVRAAALSARGAAHELPAYLARVARTGGLVTLAFSATIAAFPGVLARIFYGSVDAQQELAIRGFALHYLVVFAITIVTIRLRTAERTRPIFVAQALGAGFAAFGAHATVQAFGLPGAIVGIVLQQVLVLLVLLLAVRASNDASAPLQAARTSASGALP